MRTKEWLAEARRPRPALSHYSVLCSQARRPRRAVPLFPLFEKGADKTDNCSRRQDDHSTIEPTATLHGKPWNRSLRAIYETLPVTRHVLLFFLFLVKDYEDCRKEKDQPYEGALNEMEQGRTTTTIPQKW